jgi:hypothetical protein
MISIVRPGVAGGRTIPETLLLCLAPGFRSAIFDRNPAHCGASKNLSKNRRHVEHDAHLDTNMTA